MVTTTGSGWVVPALADSFEYLSGGDCATVAIQYSYLPSWISYLVDKSKALAAGQAIFDAVYGAWAKLPPAHRPRLFAASESLGSFGGEAAFTDAQDIANLTSGVLFSGPPSFNTLFGDFRDHRQPASPEVQPVYQHGGSSGSPAIRRQASPRRAGPGTAPGSCTCCTRPIRWCGGART